jgi:hypothetical protein
LCYLDCVDWETAFFELFDDEVKAVILAVYVDFEVFQQLQQVTRYLQPNVVVLVVL